MPRAHSRDFHWDGKHYELNVYSDGRIDCDRIGTCFGNCEMRRVKDPERELSEEESTAFREHLQFESLKTKVVATLVLIVFAMCVAMILFNSFTGKP